MKLFGHIQVVFLWRLLAFLCTFGEVELKPSTTTRTHYRGLQLFDANERISNQINSSSLLRRNGDQVSKNRDSNQWKRDEETIASKSLKTFAKLPRRQPVKKVIPSLRAQSVTKFGRSIRPQSVTRFGRSIRPQSVTRFGRSIRLQSVTRLGRSIRPQSVTRFGRSIRPQSVTRFGRSIRP